MKLRFLPLLTLAALGLSVMSTGCGKEVVRGSNDPSIDAHALSTGWTSRLFPLWKTIPT